MLLTIKSVVLDTGNLCFFLAIFDMINFDDESDEKYIRQMTIKLYGGFFMKSLLAIF